ncbi:unnamed protein product [Kuraishia capsulata CBS 1993]|uniref:Chromatin associated protein KTI12 n=1 Tax=Kuraishia capsulata CBS 1993 TaxID=1382522 RepID=W6ML82_9ASCO|nr:uncharacterized protein KUCA_T00003227001 [Kuraishia capsulata CBS 1993]CDK27249.1 unnamed protein product [Kuraishia capsulata CBS 1993]
MPLILLSGFPSSGKTTWANKLADQMRERISSLSPGEPGSNLKVILHNDESLGIKHEDYIESRHEKAARGTQISAVKRDLSKNNVIILDSMAYIKGFRYQLHCESKALSTSHCVIHVLAPTEICFQWNSARPAAERWDEDLLKSLIMRYEEPDARNRWDSPLIGVAYDDQNLPFEEIWESVALKKGLRPNNATVLKPASSMSFLQELDQLTSSVVNKVVQHQQQQIGGQDVPIDKDLYVHLPQMQTVSIAQLQRIRRTYVTLNRMRTVDTTRITPLFVEYLNNSLESSES